MDTMNSNDKKPGRRSERSCEVKQRAPGFAISKGMAMHWKEVCGIAHPFLGPLPLGEGRALRRLSRCPATGFTKPRVREADDAPLLFPFHEPGRSAPVSGAATMELAETSGFLQTHELAKAAAPEDGRTPVQVSKARHFISENSLPGGEGQGEGEDQTISVSNRLLEITRGVSGILSGLAIFLLLIGSAAFAHAETNRPPNLIVILTDDQGYADVGFNGCKDIPTPNLDSIAAHGVRFSNGYVSYPVCSPSRAGLLTGRYEQRFGHERNPRFEPNNPKSGLPLSETTLADALGRVGYQSGIIGKWHLGAHPDLHPLKRGFNEFFGHLGGGHRYFPEELTLRDTNQATNEEQSYRLWILRNHEPVRTTNYLTDEFSDEAVRFVERHQNERFFLYLAYNAPHAPLQATEKYLSRFPNIKNPKRRTYAAMVSAVDDGVGRLLAKLRELNLETNTLVFYLSDNGGPEQANASDNGPLRGGKSDPWEGGIRVPFAVQWPGQLPKGAVYDKPVLSLDIFATMTALAGATNNPARPLDGVNLLPYLTGRKTGTPHDTIYLRMYDKGAFAVRRGENKLVIPRSGVSAQLFNLAADLGETNNLSAAQSKTLAELEQLRASWSAQLIPPVFDGLMAGTNSPANRKAVED